MPDPVREDTGGGGCDAKRPGAPSDRCQLDAGHEGNHSHDDGLCVASWPNFAAPASSSKDEEGGGEALHEAVDRAYAVLNAGCFAHGPGPAAAVLHAMRILGPHVTRKTPAPSVSQQRTGEREGAVLVLSEDDAERMCSLLNHGLRCEVVSSEQYERLYFGIRRQLDASPDDGQVAT